MQFEFTRPRILSFIVLFSVIVLTILVFFEETSENHKRKEKFENIFSSPSASQNPSVTASPNPTSATRPAILKVNLIRGDDEEE